MPLPPHFDPVLSDVFVTPTQCCAFSMVNLIPVVFFCVYLYVYVFCVNSICVYKHTIMRVFVHEGAHCKHVHVAPVRE